MLEAEPMERDRWAGDDLLALDSAVAPIAEVGEYAFVHDVEGLHAQVVLAPGRPSTPPNGCGGPGHRYRVYRRGSARVEVQPVSALQCEPGGSCVWSDRRD